jgi:hypothetical protein
VKKGGDLTMARVTGPLFSLDASGTIANAMTFSKWKGMNYVRLRVIPANPQTASQTSQRNTLAAATSCWKHGTSIDAVSKSSWNASASGTGMSGFNRYTSVFIRTNTQKVAPWTVPAVE